MAKQARVGSTVGLEEVGEVGEVDGGGEGRTYGTDEWPIRQGGVLLVR